MKQLPLISIPLILGLYLLGGRPVLAQCPMLKPTIDTLFYNKTIPVPEQKAMLDEAIDCCTPTWPRDSCVQRNRCAWAHHHLGNLLMRIGAFERAKTHLERARGIYCDPTRKRDVDADLIPYEKNQGNLDEAIANNRKLLSQRPSCENIYIVIQLADLLIQQGSYGDAAFTLSSLSDCEVDQHRDRHWFYMVSARIEQAQGKLSQAEQHWEQALAYAEQDFDKRSSIYAKVWLAMGEEFYVPQGRYLKAQQAYQQALAAYIPAYQAEEQQLPNAHQVKYTDDDIMLILAAKARAYWLAYQQGEASLEDLERALRCFDLSVTVETSLREFYESTAANYFMVAERHAAMELALRICAELYQQTGREKFVEAALHFSELAKDVLLKEESSVINFTTENPSQVALIEQHQRLRQTMTELELSGFQQRQRKEELLEAWSKHLDKLRLGAPTYFASKFQYVDPTLKFIRKELLGEEQALIEYYIGQESSYAMVITDRESAMVEIPLVQQDMQRVDAFSQLIQGVSAGNGSRTLFQAQAHQWYALLLQPIEVQLRLPKRLLIVPDNRLARLPIDALLIEENDPYSFVLFRYATSMAYSVGMLEQGLKLASETSEVSYLGVAPVEFLAPQDLMKHSKAEVELGKALWKGKTLCYSEATKEELLKHIESCDILHLATHGKESAPPYLALYGGEKLYLPEFYHLRLKARLAILSACESNLGEVREGEGLLGLTRGLHYAGTPSVLSTQWQVRQEMQSKLVQQYLEYLKEGMAKDLALAQTKREFLGHSASTYMDPYFWSGLVQFGLTAPLEDKSWGVHLRSYLSIDLPFWFIALVTVITFWLVSRLWQGD